MRSAALIRAIEAVSGTAELARRLGISSQAVSQWDEVPAERVIAVERATEGSVKRYELRPDLYPPENAMADPAAAGNKPSTIAEEDLEPDQENDQGCC